MKCWRIADTTHLRHFADEHTFTPYMMFGTRGVYSSFGNFNARCMVECYDTLCAGRWDLARHQQRDHAFKRAAILDEEGNLHGIYGKALAACSSFSVPNNRTRRPYLPMREETIARFRRIVDEQFPDTCWKG